MWSSSPFGWPWSGAVLLLGLLTAGVRGDDWPQLRGPRADGIATGESLADNWPASGPRLLWTVRLGQGFSGFVIAEGRAVTQYQTPLGQFVICLDVRDGHTLWERRYAEPYDPIGVYPGPRATPAIDAGRVFYHAPGGAVGALSLYDGTPLWSVDVKQVYGLSGTGFGCAASPLVREGRIYLPVGGRQAAVIALAAATGERVWASGADPASYCTSQPLELGGVPLVASLLQNCLVIQERESGREVWRLDLSAGYDEHAAAPLFDDSLLVFSAPFRAGASAYRLTCERDDSGKLRLASAIAWQSRQLSNDTASSVVYDGRIFGFDLKDAQAKVHRPSRGEFRCLNLTDGQVAWSAVEPGHATVIVADGKLVLFNDRGELILARASGSAYEELGRTSVFDEEICWTAPALSDGRLIVRSHSRAACFDIGRERPGVERPASAVQMPRVPFWRRWRWNWLLGGEREHPFMRAEWDELRLWYLVCVAACWLPATLLMGLGRLLRPTALPSAQGAADLSRQGLALVLLGIAVTPLANHLSQEFVLTWPAALYGTLQTSLGLSWGLRQTPDDRPLKWRARLAGGLLLAVGAAYFLLLRDQSLPHEWVFLICTVCAVPSTLAVVALVHRRTRAWVLSVASLIGFTVYFWLAPLIPWVRDALLEGLTPS